MNKRKITVIQMVRDREGKTERGAEEDPLEEDPFPFEVLGGILLLPLLLLFG